MQLIIVIVNSYSTIYSVVNQIKRKIVLSSDFGE